MRHQDRHVVDSEFGRADIVFVERLIRTRSHDFFGDDRHERATLATVAQQRRHVAWQLPLFAAGRTFPSPPHVKFLFVAGAFHDRCVRVEC